MSSSDSDDVPLSRRKQSKPISSDDDSDVPLGKRRKTNGASKLIKEESDSDYGSRRTLSKASSARSTSSLSDANDSSSDSSGSDVPLAKRGATTNGRAKKPTSYKDESSDDSSSEDEVPLAKKKSAAPKKKPASKPAPAKKTNGKVKKESSPPPTKRKTTASSSKKRIKEEEDDSSANRKRIKKEEEEDEKEQEHQWWLDMENQDDSVKWTTLHHNGVMFAPDYVPLPSNIKMKYDGKPISLAPEVEEIAGFFGSMLETDHARNPVFQKNFFNDFRKVARQYKTQPEIKEFAKCDFTSMFEYFQEQREKKKAMTKEDKAKIKAEKEALKEKYGFATLDGRKEKVGNFMVEPPGLFRGRGEHPKTGCLKLRVLPEMVTLNLSKDAPIPPPPAGHKWAGIEHDNTKSWLATWKENINGSTKYVFLGADSSLKGISDMKKFELARELKGKVKEIRARYTAELKDKVMFTRQRATAVWLIDHLALRAGNEKGQEEADTVGCCSLRYEHVTLEKPNILHLDFLGKDSIRFQKSVEVDDQVFKNIKLFKKEPAAVGDDLFDRLKTSDLNKYLQEQMPGLTAKVFRTYNASITFQEQLALLTPKDGTMAEKLLAYNRANREVAILCNHQRTVSKNHSVQMEKIVDKIRALKYQRHKIKQTMLTLEPKLAKKRPELAEPESDLEDEWIEKHEEDLIEKDKEKARQKFAKDNEKRQSEKEKPLPASDLKDILKSLDAKLKDLVKERKTGKVINADKFTIERCDNNLLKIDERIATQRAAMVDKDENKSTALSTSKMNYIDPRITIAWCDKYEVPFEKIYTKTLRDKFKWAAVVDGSWEF
ncbi:DNA topoisomerase 1 [Actinomortierella ambigua]|uniref:DNA topoisomerase I n=1 Tax=Actinomortierella ambigua TaxID=1343610 RepID=A0A9P6QJK5_9FUNG|nr:DNA topoisomerase 1 [Actinomortierella ambigua]